MRARAALLALTLASLAGCAPSPQLLCDRGQLVEVGQGAYVGLLTGRYEDALPDEPSLLLVAVYFEAPPSGLASLEHDVRRGLHPGLRLVWSPAGGPRAGLPHEVRAEVSPRSGGLRIREQEYRLEEGRVFVVRAREDGTVTSRQIDARPAADAAAVVSAVRAESSG